MMPVNTDAAREAAARLSANLNGHFEAGPWPDPVDILSEMAAQFPIDFARSTGFDPSLTLSAAVSVAAAALSDGFQIVGNSKSQWFQQPRLWILDIARPGAGKTPAQRAMLAPL